MTNEACKLCGWSRAEHRPGGDAPGGHSYQSDWTPRFRFPSTDRTEDRGREAFATFDPLRDTFWWELPSDIWTTAYRLIALPGGRISVCEVRMFPTDPPGVYDTRPGEWSGSVESVPARGLTARAARAHINPGGHQDHARERLEALQEHMGPRAFEAFMGRWGVAASAVQGLTSKRKPSARRERFIAAVAAAYHHHVQRGSRRPVADVADDFGISRSTARDVIHEARRRGFLSGTQQGVAGGSITDLALRVLAAEVDEEDA